MNHSFQSIDQLITDLKSAGQLTQEIDDGFIVNKSQGKPAFLISVLIHGNEVLGYHLLEKILNSINAQTLSFGILIGNRASYLANKRFIEKDLNRSFTQTEHKLKEELRAKEIEGFCRNFPFILDVHQTSAESKGYFYITKNGKSALNLISQLNCENLPIVVSPINFKSKEGNTFSQFCVQENIPTTTIEVGQRGFSKEGLEFSYMLFSRLASVDVSALNNEIDPQLEVFVLSETIKKETEADQLVTGIQNLADVNAGDLLATVNAKEWRSPISGKTLFPKYGEYQKFSKDLCQILELKKIKDVTP